MLHLLQLEGLHSLKDLVWKMLVKLAIKIVSSLQKWIKIYYVKANILNYIYFEIQINVQTQRGFVPVDERMRVIDANGKLVSLQFIFLIFYVQKYLWCAYYSP